MKKVHIGIQITLAALLFSSCSSVNGLFYNGKLIQKRTDKKEVSELPEKHVSNENAANWVSIEENLASSELKAEENVVQMDFADASNELVLSDVTPSRNFTPVNKNFTETKKFTSNSEKIKRSGTPTISKKEYSYREYKNRMKDDVDKVVIIVLCFFIPPLAVYLFEGSWTNRCTLNLILTLLCGLPGVIHALVVVLK